MQQGIGLLRDEKYPDALNKFDNVLKYDDRNAKAHIGRGQALCGDNQIGPSLEEYDKALEIEPDNKNALISKANSLSKSGDYDNAIDLYKRGIDVDDGSDNCIHLLNYALCLYNKNDLDNAYNVLERAERSYEAQKDKLAPKERQFFEENVDKLKKNREGGETGGIEIQEQLKQS